MNESNKRKHIINARKLLREQHTGVLATQSLSIKGFPFGSVTPFLMSDCGDLIVYASDIAQHSRNMKADVHVSVCVYDSVQIDSQASARVTLLAKASWDDVSEELQQRYFALFPHAEAYVQAHDFRFYKLTTHRVRYIGGFGEIFWFSEQEWRENFADLQPTESAIVTHMNEDHLDAIQLMLHQHHDVDVDSAQIKMLTAFAEGFHVTVGQQVYFIQFEQPLKSADEIRKAMVSLTHQARASATVAA